MFSLGGAELGGSLKFEKEGKADEKHRCCSVLGSAGERHAVVQMTPCEPQGCPAGHSISRRYEGSRDASSTKDRKEASESLHDWSVVDHVTSVWIPGRQAQQSRGNFHSATRGEGWDHCWLYESAAPKDDRARNIVLVDSSGSAG